MSLATDTALLPISLVIPAACGQQDLIPLITALGKSRALPAQLIVVDVLGTLNDVEFLIRSNLTVRPELKSVRITTVCSSTNLFPGAARNLAISESLFPVLAFLDVNTIPSSDWLLDSYSQLYSLRSSFVQGCTTYSYLTYFQKIVSMAVYGWLPIPTLPGSLMTRRFLAQVGEFLPNIRAGEDTEWLHRVKSFISTDAPLSRNPLLYVSLPNNLFALGKKWLRNYSSSVSIVTLIDAQRVAYLFSLLSALLLVALCWNSFFAEWNMASPFYVPNIAKIVVFSIVTAYISLRAFLLPFSRGVRLSALLPFNWIPITLITFYLDFLKLLVFICAPFLR